MKRKANYSGFTLIEILVVVGLIAILAAITIVAINPAKNFAQTRDAQRSSDVGAILNAITQYTSEEGHTLDGLVDATGYGDGTATGGAHDLPTCDTNVAIINQRAAVALTADDKDLGIDLYNVVVDEYIVAVPEDPSQAADVGTNARDTAYEVCETTGGRVTVSANPERSTAITVSR